MDVETFRKSIKKDTPCPFGYGHHDLRGCNLTLFQKYWLGSRIVFKVLVQATSKSVSNYASEHWSSMQPHLKIRSS